MHNLGMTSKAENINHNWAHFSSHPTQTMPVTYWPTSYHKSLHFRLLSANQTWQLSISSNWRVSVLCEFPIAMLSDGSPLWRTTPTCEAAIENQPCCCGCGLAFSWHTEPGARAILAVSTPRQKSARTGSVRRTLSITL